MFKKKWLSMSLIALMIFSLFPIANFSNDYAEASEPMKKKVLEIVDRGDSKLSGVLDEKQYEVETVRMKKFVALREQLDGKYDVIYIGEGTYSPKKLTKTTDKNRASSHNTTDMYNDITNLKAEEIIEDYIEKNQLVVIHNTSLNRTNNIKKHFSTYKSSPRKNVKFVNSPTDAKNAISSFEYVRPRLAVTEKPQEYPNGKSYEANEKISFSFNVAAGNASNDLTANLYIDANFNHKYEASELVQSQNMSGNSGTLQYQLPKGYTGLRYWKLEIVDRNNRLKDYASGVFKFKGEKVEIRVLQVTSGSNDNSRLTLDDNMNQSYLNTDDYEIKIDTVDMNSFANSTNDYSHTKLNGTYDMLIFGFNDSYNDNATLTPNAAQSVQNFIATGQSVMFTHDTIFNDNNIWVNNFMDATGQKFPWTNLGFGAPEKSTTTKKINERLLTQFPYQLGDNITIATTHNQYYTLDLEDPSIIPWYNITGGRRDNDDSWNHYYTYSKGNITYSGTGHTNSGFPIEEQKLFVNTMFRAFLGANTAPAMNVLSPNEGITHLNTQDLELVYEAYDLDLTDRELKTRIFLNNSTTPIFTDNKVANGKLVRFSIDHKQLINGTNNIRIEVEDSSGAITKSERSVNVQEAELNLVKNVSKTKAVVGEEIEVSYSIGLSNTSGYDTETKAQSGDAFPYAIERDELTRYGNNDIPLADDNSKGNYGWLEANDGSGASKLRAMILAGETVNVSINGKLTTEPGNMNMTSTVKEWLNGSTKTVVIPIVKDFPNGRKDIPVKELGVFDIFEKADGKVYLRYKGHLKEVDKLKLSNIKIKDFLPNGIELSSNLGGMLQKQVVSNGTNITISLEDISLGQLLKEPIEINYKIQSTKQGIFVMDQSALEYKLGNSQTKTLPFNSITIEVVQPVNGVEIRNDNSEIIVGEEPRRLFFDIVPNDATNREEAANTAVWTSSDPSVVSIDENGYIIAHKQGSATITLAVDDVDGVNRGVAFTDTIVIHAAVPLQSISIEGNSNLFVGDQQRFAIGTSPKGVSQFDNVTWSIVNGGDVIQLLPNGEVKALKPGTAVIRVEVTFKGKTFFAEKSITVKELRIDPNNIEVNVGVTNSELKANIYSSAIVSTPAPNVTWTISDTKVAKIDSNGRVTGLSEGTATVTAKIVENGVERIATAKVTVKYINLTSITSDSVIVVQKGKFKNISLQFTPSNATNKEVTYSIDNSSYATVDANGKVTGLEVRYGYREGKLTIIPAAIIKVTSKTDPSVSVEISVVVVEEGYNDNGDNNGNGWKW